jgi:hypothetical protein
MDHFSLTCGQPPSTCILREREAPRQRRANAHRAFHQLSAQVVVDVVDT